MPKPMPRAEPATDDTRDAMTERAPDELSEADLEQVSGGLLLPAVQAAREAARRSS